MRISTLIRRLEEVRREHGDLPVMIWDSECDQELRTISPLGISATGEGEIVIEAFE